MVGGYGGRCGNAQHLRPGPYNIKLGNDVEHPGSVNSQSVCLAEEGKNLFLSNLGSKKKKNRDSTENTNFAE